MIARYCTIISNISRYCTILSMMVRYWTISLVNFLTVFCSPSFIIYETYLCNLYNDTVFITKHRVAWISSTQCGGYYKSACPLLLLYLCQGTKYGKEDEFWKLIFFFKSRNKGYLSNQRPIRITIIGCSVNSLRMKISDIIHSLTLVLKLLEVKSIDCKNMTEENIKRIRDMSLHENTINCCAFYSHLLFKVLKIFAIILR